jgi:hypothetical protein
MTPRKHRISVAMKDVEDDSKVGCKRDVDPEYARN